MKPSKSLETSRFPNSQLNESISDPQIKKNNLKISFKRNNLVSSEQDLVSANVSPKGEKADSSTISKYEKMVFTTVE